jgi:isoquinoline 1-oxidoreductase alpha subunit
VPKYEIKVNGSKKAVTASADMPLLWVLRDRFGLLGTKPGCGNGTCGCCTVHVDGVPKPSCQLPIESVGSSAITTIEGLEPKRLAALERAWVDEDVVQCGYCQPAQIMTAAALLHRVPKPTDAQIDDAMVVLCRCGTYNRIRRAIKRAAGEGKGR